MSRKFVAAVNIPSPYRVYIWREVCEQLRGRGIEFELHIMSRGHKARPDSWRNPEIDYTHRYWKDYGWGSYHFNPGMIAHMMKERPDWLFCSSPYDTITGACLMTLCSKSCRIAWQETNTKTPGKIDGFIGWFKRFVLTRAQFVGVPGSDAIKQMSMHQARTQKKMPPCVILPNLVDERRFAPVDRMKKARLKQEMFGITSNVKVCFVPARPSPEKGVLPFVKLLTPDMLSNWKVIIAGKGPQKEEVLAVINDRGLTKSVTVIDNVQYSRMPDCYAASDLVLLPSLRDANPLVSVEALHSGLPLALSCMAGNVEEAVIEGKNGWVLPVGDCKAFEAMLREIFDSSTEKLEAKGQVSKEVNSRFWHTKEAISRFLDNIGAR